MDGQLNIGPKGANLFIYHLPTDVQEDFLFSLFSEYGTVVSTNVLFEFNFEQIYRDRESNKSKGFGFVCFSSPEEATKAVTEMNGRIVGSKPLYVALAQRKEERKAHLTN